MPKPVKAIPEGFHSLTPTLTVKGGDKAIEFYKRAFGAEDVMRMAAPDGKILHGELRIGNSIFFVSDEFQGLSRSPQTLGGTATSLYVYVENADALIKRAVEAGAKVTMPIADQFWGDRCGGLVDPFGHQWTIATHIKDPTPEELRKGQEEFTAKMSRK